MDSKKNSKDTDGGKPKFSEKISNYYDNVKSRLLGNDLTGRRQTYQENSFGAETSLTGFKRDHAELHLKPVNVDLCRPQNRQAHHTAEYEAPNLIIRRGQPFDITIDFNRNYIKGQDSISLKFITGTRPSQSRGSVISVVQGDKLQEGHWGFELSKVHDKSVTLRVSSPCDAIVGRYELFIDTTHQKNEAPVKYRHKNPDDIFLLFNPWQKDDAVYVSSETDRKEYVQAETGRIWLGSQEKSYPRPWNFGQFDYVCLIAAVSILDRSEITDRARANPALVVRAICRGVNYTEGAEGVIQASWSGKYDDGEAPYSWTSSPSILEEYIKTRKGVKYGQCWTMAAVTTTLLRTLGIASRCVTCYKSAHDSDYSGAINMHWSHDLKPRTELDDGIWNFHVWNEAWFSRSDLPPGYDGWQALDPTPLDCSEGVVTCGPAPVKAILQGDLHIGFDSKYLFAELNGGSVYWQVDIHGDMEAFMEGGSVGGAVCTKSVGTASKEDIAASYKHSEGSKEAKEVLEKAGKLCSRKTPVISQSSKRDVEFKANGGMDKGGDIKLTLQVQNVGSEGRIVDVYLGAFSSFYTGLTSAELKKVVSSLVLEPKKVDSVVLELKCSEFIGQKLTDSNVTSYIMAKVRETGQRFAHVQSYCLDHPHLEIKTDSKVILGKNVTAVIKLKNTLSVPLTNGVMSVDGPGVVKESSVKLKKQVEPGEEIREAVSLTTRRAGVNEVIVTFNCQQVCNVAAATELEIVKS
ncbi:unnamed protein product [Candidula unifasciata]|uniref:Transglutaminase-like domain-containing protein n=1 Tax=Candidula unifasciata TaxID=100452 RepID=A0A8S3ZSN2_9EUPU|nr:unnamed protein product [Candidula unifasciata]